MADVSTEVLVDRVAALERLIDERDRLYSERHAASAVAIAAALASVKDQTAAAFKASETATECARISQGEYNTFHNDLQRAMTAQYAQMVPRAEFEAHQARSGARIDELRGEIGALRESRSAGQGKSAGITAAMAFAAAVVSALLGAAALLLSFLRP
jgi:hypothetical protein